MTMTMTMTMTMKHLDNFKLFESRKKPLSKEEFKKILYNNCKNWINNPKPLIRYSNYIDSEFNIMNPKNHKRKSLNDSNHVNMLIGNLPSWSKFPDRSRSLIFLSSIEETVSFGDHIYFVIPFDNSRIGCSGSSDMWYMENNSINFKLNSRLSNDFAELGVPDEYEEFSEFMNEFMDNDNKYIPSGRSVSNPGLIYLSEIEGNYNKNKDKFKNFMDYFNNIMRPSNFHGTNKRKGFTLENYKSLPKDISLECWTDSKCLLYYVGDLKELSKLNFNMNIHKKFSKFLKNLK